LAEKLKLNPLSKNLSYMYLCFVTAEAGGRCRGGGQAEAEPALQEPVIYVPGYVSLQLKLEGVAGVADRLKLNPLSKNLTYMCFVTAEA
jgi:hypothetical protein